MTDRPVTAVPGVGPPAGIQSKLEPNAIGVTQDTVIGMASSAPAGTIAATLAALALATAYGSGPVLHPDCDPDDHHCQFLPAAEPLER